MFLRMQAFNLAIINEWLTGSDYEVLDKPVELEHAPIEETAFLAPLQVVRGRPSVLVSFYAFDRFGAKSDNAKAL